MRKEKLTKEEFLSELDKGDEFKIGVYRKNVISTSEFKESKLNVLDKIDLFFKDDI